MVQDIKHPLIVANWKMYKGAADTEAFLSALVPLVDQRAELWFAVPFTSIATAHQLAVGTPWRIGAQNMNDASEGAFTGEIAAQMLKEAGAEFVLLGHSERRLYFREDNAFINRKVKKALQSNLKPLLCIGETLEQRKDGEMEDTLAIQLAECLADISEEALAQIIIAYEPIWAIGTGLTASPEQAQEAHLFTREYLAQHWGSNTAKSIRLLYGGSVKADNAASLLAQKDIDGLLVGGASLVAASFAAIANSAPESPLHSNTSHVTT